jgi:Flp pilus assembly protein TadD
MARRPACPAATQSLAQTSLATLALGERRFDDAERHARAALALEPGNALAQGTLAVALDDLGRLDEAEAAYRAALVLDPALYANEWNLALLLAGQPARRSEAAEHLRRFLARAPAGDPRLAEARRALERLSAASGGGG